MKAVVYHDESTIRCEEVARPEIAEGEILIRMRACGICGGDLMSWYKKAPLVLGHEVTGEVVEARGEEARVKVGDRVTVHHHVACHACHFCAHGDYVHCAQFSRNRIYPGGFAEYIRVSAPIARGDVLSLPPQLTFEAGTLVEPLACCIKGINRAGLLPGDSLGVIGAGPVGIMSVALARRTRGAGTVIAADTVESRRRYAREFGADIAVDPREVPFATAAKEATEGRGLDAVIVAVSGSRAIEQGIEAVRNGGIIVIFAPPPPQDMMTLSPNALYFAEKRLVPSYSSSHKDTREALRLMQSGVLDLQRMITHTFPMEDAEKAFRLAESREGLKVLITNG